MPIHNRTFFILSLMTLFALFIRLQYVQQTVIDQPIRADARQYVIYGYNLYAHGIFSKEINAHTPKPDSFRSPGYPFFISLAFGLGGKQAYYPVIIYAQTLMGALLVPFTFGIGIRFLSLSWAFTAASLVAISPHLIAMTSYVLTETLFSFLVLLSVYCISVALEKKRLHYFVISGLFSGAAYLTNETFFFLPFLFVIFSIYSIYRTQDEKRSTNMRRCVFVYMIIFFLFPFAWNVRNHNIDSDPSKGPSRAVLSLSHGAYPDFVYKDKNYKYYPYLEDPMQPAFGATFQNFVSILGERFREKPFRYLRWYLLEKPYYFWSWDNLQSRMGERRDRGEGDIYVYPVKTSLYYSSPMANFSRLGMKCLHPFFLIAACIGIPVFIIVIRRNKEGNFLVRYPGFLFVVLTYYTLLHIIFAPWPRYSVPLRPELYLFALWTLKHGMDCSARRLNYQKD